MDYLGKQIDLIFEIIHDTGLDRLITVGFIFQFFMMLIREEQVGHLEKIIKELTGFEE